MTSDQPRLATDYHAGLLSKDAPHERERLGLLEQWGDPESQAVLAQCGLSAASHCLEIGAGAVWAVCIGGLLGSAAKNRSPTANFKET